MTVQMVHAKIQPDRVADIEAGAKKMFAAINEAEPEGIKYASCLAPDGETFIAFLQIDEGVENPLPEFPAFQAFLADVEASRAEPAAVQPLEVIASYRLF